MAAPIDEATDLLRHLIRAACVNDGTPESGHEARAVGILQPFLEQAGVELERVEPLAGRASLVLRVEGSDPRAPSLHLCSHTDVVPVNRSGWSRDPFAAELADGVVWGRGAVDMLGTTAAMAVAVRRLLAEGFRPRGTLVFTAVADEESGGRWGAEWLTENRWDAVRTDYLVTEVGGARLPVRGGPRLPVMVAEKGAQWTKLRVRGTPGHGSMPYRSDNAAVKAGEVLARIARYRAPARLGSLWREFLAGLGLPAWQRALLGTAPGLDRILGTLPLGTARMFHAATRTTLSPNLVRSGVKINVIPDGALVEVDIRTAAGDEGEPARRMLADAVGDLWSECEIVEEWVSPASASPRATPLWDALEATTRELVPGASAVPMLLVGLTDARFFRRKGVVAYGYGLFSERIPFDAFGRMFHGNDEHVDTESVGLSVALWDRLVRRVLA